MPRRRRRALPVAAVVVSLGLAGLGFGSWQLAAAGRVEPPGPGARQAVLNSPGRSPAAPAGSATSGAERAPRPISYPVRGPGRWLFATGNGAVAGRSGDLLRYRVAVEEGIAGLTANEFAGRAEATLADPRSWTAGGQWRLRRVGPDGPYDFTIYLATPATRDELCAMGYDRYTSCRNGDRVVVNVARWAHGVPHYGASLDTYRQYVVNHEVGHRLGHGHELCPGQGRPAPVMQQQTLGLHGCTAFAWPWRDGNRYAGPSGAYD